MRGPAMDFLLATLAGVLASGIADTASTAGLFAGLLHLFCMLIVIELVAAWITGKLK